MTAEEPLVSCIMPTRDRRRFVPTAIGHFLRQDYPARELIVVDDGDDSVGDLIPSDERIRYIRLERRATVGRKRNVACEAARGAIVAHWDDDDWHARDRLSRQVRGLDASGIDLCGTSALRFYDPAARRAWDYRYPDHLPRWVAGGTLAYRRAFWSAHGFDDVDIGEDALFVWKAHPSSIAVLDDASFYLAVVHDRNVSPKRTDDAYWRPCPVELVERQLGSDLTALDALFRHTAPAPAASGVLRNVHACLVHERPPCIADLIRNLRRTDPDSAILLYNGSTDPGLLDFAFPFEAFGAVKHPRPRPMRWGWLHEFAVDAMRFAVDDLGADLLTVVDSDQLAIRAGYAPYVSEFVRARPHVGLLGSSARVEQRGTAIGPAAQAWAEVDRWRPLLAKFPGGDRQFARWTFWPTTVVTAPAMRELVDLFEHDRTLAALMTGTSMWATEEVLFPTLTALLGFEVAENPCRHDLVRYRVPCTEAELERARREASIFWVHPVARDERDPIRNAVRRLVEQAPKAARPPAARSSITMPASDVAVPRLLRTLPILARMRTVDGWLSDDEADMLIALVREVVAAKPAARIVELGSYCGRGTTVLGSAAADAPAARVYAIDAHDGRLGERDRPVRVAPSEARLRETIRRFALQDVVVPIRAQPTDVAWSGSIDLLVVDAFHDYASVSADVAHYEPHLAPDAFVAFHDDAAYFPGVRQYLADLDACARYRRIATVDTLTVVQRRSEAP